MRLFVATLLPPADAAFYAALMGTASASIGPRVLRVATPATMHVTHAFLGDVSETDVPAIVDVLGEVARPTTAIDVVFGRPEVLGGGRGPRAVLVPVADGRQALFDWQIDLTLALRRAPRLDTLPMPKSPHVTIARFSRAATRRDGQQVAELLARTSTDGRSMRIARIQLMRSTLTPAGPHYDELAGVELQRPTSTRAPAPPQGQASRRR